jgi:UDP-2,3-diacylglucosamine pyrophosphatase LpxH
MICGHTHRSVFPNSGEAPYYNTGSGVHPRCITGIEIADGALA